MEKNSNEQVVHVRGKNTLGIITLVLGILSLLGCWIPLLNVISIIIAIAGIVVGICAFISFFRKKSSSCVLSIIGTIISVISVIFAYNLNNAVFSDKNIKSVATKVSSSSENTEPASNTSSSEQQDSSKTTETIEEYKVGDVISFDEKFVTVTNVKRNYSTGNEFQKPKSGKEFVKVTIKIENKSDNDISLNSLDFKVGDSNGLLVTSDSSTYSLDDQFESFSKLAPNGNVSGSIIFEVPKDDNNLKLIYEPSFWSSKKITIKL